MTEPTEIVKFRVTVRSWNFLTAEVNAPASTTEDNLREILFGMAERGEIAWDTDVAETQVIPLRSDVEEDPAPADPTNPDFDAGAE